MLEQYRVVYSKWYWTIGGFSAYKSEAEERRGERGREIEIETEREKPSDTERFG